MARNDEQTPFKLGPSGNPRGRPKVAAPAFRGIPSRAIGAGHQRQLRTPSARRRRVTAPVKRARSKTRPGAGRGHGGLGPTAFAMDAQQSGQSDHKSIGPGPKAFHTV
jgi:hypothetical protein